MTGASHGSFQENKFESSGALVSSSTSPPEHWSRVKLDDVAFIRKGTVAPCDYRMEFELYSIPAFHATGIPEVKMGREIGSSKVIVHHGDCLFGKLNPRVPKVWLVGPSNERRQIATTEFFPIVSREGKSGEKWLLPEFIFFMLKSPEFQARVVRKVLGTTASRQRLSPEDVTEERIPIASREEQSRVVARIVKILAMVEHAAELREHSLNDTRVIMKSALWRVFSNFKANGWRSMKLEELGNVTSGGTPSRAVKKYFGGNITWFKAKELNDSYLTKSEETITEEGLRNSSAKLLRKDSIIIGMYDTAAGKLGILSFEGSTNQACAALELNSEISPRYCLYALRHFRKELVESRRGIRQQNLNLGMIKRFEIPVPMNKDDPSMEIQMNIVSYLDSLEESQSG